MDKKSIKKNEVYSSEDLLVYLSDKAKENKRLYHYTTYEALLSIIKGRSLRLSRLDLLNDKAEQKLGYHDERLKNYVISFTQEKEYVSMWAMYGKASGIKIRLDFDTKCFRNCINDFYFDSDKKNRLSFYHVNALFGKGDASEPIRFSDVAYLDKANMILKHNTRSFSSDLYVDRNLIDKLTGFVKYDAWEFEKETRLKVQLNEDRYSIDRKLPEYIYCGITEDLIRSFHVTFNPWMTPILKEEIRKSLHGVAGFEIECSDSVDDGEITEL